MLYIIGLGNPGEKYKNTRHNIGWIVLDEIVHGEWSFHKYMNAEINTESYGLCIKPQTFMNNSGEVISFLKKEVTFEPEHIVIVYDDIDLAFGDIRISYDRGDGGHNGIKSITNHLGSKKTIRIRMGISRRISDNESLDKKGKGRLAKPNVLGNFPPEEHEIIKNDLAPKIERIIKSLVEKGREKTMNTYNSTK